MGPGSRACLQVTGIPMNCSVKLQLSLFVKKVKGIGYVQPGGVWVRGGPPRPPMAPESLPRLAEGPPTAGPGVHPHGAPAPSPCPDPVASPRHLHFFF